MRRAAALVVLLLGAGRGALAAQDSLPPAQVPALPPPVSGQPAGRIAGRVIDRETGRPLQGIRILISSSVAQETDLDGRYRSFPLTPRRYVVRAANIGYRAVVIDSVMVVDGRTTTADFALEALTLQVEGITVEATTNAAPSSEASLLAIQQAAASVSDGISAEAISRTPAASAADAVTRVTGLSVTDGRFVVVRGLPERYNNTLLNGAELSSPDPNRRVVPLDIFPASLLEAVVATKTATPDKPGDFAGGSVEIRTREFPEEFVASLSVSQGFNSLATGRGLPVPRLSGWDRLGFDSRHRRPNTALRGEAFAESFRNVWTPGDRRVRPDLGLGVSVGGQRNLGRVPLGAAIAFTYSSSTQHSPERLFSVFSGAPDSFPADRSLLYSETRAVVDWGALANFSARLGPSHKVSWRNLYTRNAEEAALQASGYDTENSRVNQQYQVRYIAQSLLQVQLAGEHSLRGLLSSQVTWRLTTGFSRRNEPENRQAYFQFAPGSDAYQLVGNQPSTVWIRDLDDAIRSAQLDWAVPFRLRTSGDALFKVGASVRRRARDFSAVQYNLTIDPSQPDAGTIASLPPEQAFAPENVGTAIQLSAPGVRAQPYVATDRVAAGFVMLDLFPLRNVRLVGGVRYEDWQLDILAAGAGDSAADVLHQPDLLWSGNLTLSLGRRTNLRFAGFRSVTRPDARERSFDVAVPVAGACEVAGDTSITRATALNADARFEYYRRAGEIMSVSAFYKWFDQPIIETLGTPGGGNCRATTRNATSARNFGVELEARRELFAGFEAGFNFTFVESRVVMPAIFGAYDADLALAGQSPWLLNVNAGYASRSGRLAASLLFNYFASRIVRYGLAASAGGQQNPSVYERGRGQLDAKVQVALPAGVILSLSGRNLTDAVSEYYHPTRTGGDVRQGFERTGVGFTIGLARAL